MYFIPLGLHIRVFDDLKELLFDLLAEDTAWNLPEEFLQDAGDRIDTEVVHVYEASRLQEVGQLLHRTLVAWGPKHVLAIRSLLVELQYQHLRSEVRTVNNR